MPTTRLRAQRSQAARPVSATRDAWYDRPSEDSVLQEQFFDSQVNLTAVCPETALL